MNTWLIAGFLLSALAPFGTYCLWQGQQEHLRALGSKPVLEISVDPKKSVRMRNVGAVTLQDVRIYLVPYTLKRTPDGVVGPAWTGILAFNKPGGPSFALEEGLKAGEKLSIDLPKSTPAAFYDLTNPR